MECELNPRVDLGPILHLRAATLPVTVFLALALASLVMLPRVLVELSRAPWEGRRRDVTTGATLFASALALRGWLSTHALVHENHHGYYYVVWPAAVNHEAATHGVSSAHLLLLRLFGAVAGVGDASTFRHGALLSSVAVVGLAAYTAQVTRSRVAGWAAGALLALQPLAVALSTTEEFLVTASGLCLAGVALLHAGASLGLRATLALGVALLSLGAGAREVTLPLSALAVAALLSARTAEGRVPWRAALAACGAVAVLLLPHAWSVVSAWRAQPATPGFFGAPTLPWRLGYSGSPDPRWVGWIEPFVPRWEGWAMVLALAALALACAWRRDGRLALGALAPPVIALAQGGLVNSGWFPSHLRHQLLAMALMLLPVGWLVAALAQRLPQRARAALPLAVVALAAVSLARRPEGRRLDVPSTQEYRFFHDTLASLPAEGTAVAFDALPLTSLPTSWVTAQRPRWSAIDAGELRAYASPGRRAPLFLLLDRACFVDAPVFGPPPQAATPYGRMREPCARVLGALPWRPVAERAIRRSQGARVEMPSRDPVVRVAVLRWDAP